MPMTPERKRQYSTEYRAKNKLKLSENRKAWGVANAEKRKAYNAEYGKRNAEELREKAKARAAAKLETRQQAASQYYERNLLSLRQKQAAYYKQNKVAFVAKQAARHASKLSRTPPWVDKAAIESQYALRDFYTAMSLGEPFEVDHIYPLRGATVSGLHVPDNLQVIHKTDNRRKRNKVQEIPET